MTTDNTSAGTPALDGIVAEAASALADAVTLAAVGRGREGGDEAMDDGLEIAGEVIAIGDGSYGVLMVLGGVPVRVTVEPARVEEHEAVTGVRRGAVAPGDTLTYRAQGHAAELDGVVEIAVPSGVWVIRNHQRRRVEWEMVTSHTPRAQPEAGRG